MAVLQTKVLVLRFTLANGKIMTINVPNPSDTLVDEDVIAAMQAVITANIFEVGGSAVTAISDAYINDLTKTDVEVVSGA